MYDALSLTELNSLRETLYSASERAYWAVSLAPGNRGWLARYQPVHAEIASLFLEAGQEQLGRS
jgi:hypothetical protein